MKHLLTGILAITLAVTSHAGTCPRCGQDHGCPAPTCAGVQSSANNDRDSADTVAAVARKQAEDLKAYQDAWDRNQGTNEQDKKNYQKRAQEIIDELNKTKDQLADRRTQQRAKETAASALKANEDKQKSGKPLSPEEQKAAAVAAAVANGIELGRSTKGSVGKDAGKDASTPPTGATGKKPPTGPPESRKIGSMPSLDALIEINKASTKAAAEANESPERKGSSASDKAQQGLDSAIGGFPKPEAPQDPKGGGKMTITPNK